MADPIDSFWAMSGASFEGKPFKSVTQGSADLALIPLLDPKQASAPEADKGVTDFIAFIKETLGDAVSDVRSSDRLTDSVACLVAPVVGPDRQLEKMLAGAGRLMTEREADPGGQRSPRHRARGRCDSTIADREFKQDAAHFLLDEARVLEGDRPADAKQFCERLARLMRRGLAPKAS